LVASNEAVEKLGFPESIEKPENLTAENAILALFFSSCFA
jgi:hypothetical protein